MGESTNGQIDLRGAIAVFVAAGFAAGLRPSTLTHYETTLYQLVKFQDNGGGAAWPPTTEDLRAFLADKRSGGCCDVTIKTYYRSLSAFLNWCEAEGLLGDVENPVTRLHVSRDDRRIPRAVDRATLKKLFDSMASAGRRGDRLAIRDHALFRLIYDAGLRSGEASNARLADLNLQDQALTIRKAKGLPRVTYFGRTCALALAGWLAVRQPDGRWLFTSRNHAPTRLGKSGVYLRLQHWCEVAGVDRIRVHDLRHSHATHALRSGVPITDVQKQLGHARLSTTEIYLHSYDPQRRESYRRHSPADELLTLNTLSEV
jgi:integrase/recombinase XerC